MGAGLLLFVGGLIVFVSVTGIGVFSGKLEVTAILVPLGILIAGLRFLLAAPGIVGGIGRLRRRSRAGILLLIVGALNLVNVLFGTPLVGYTFRTLLQERAADALRSGERAPDRSRRWRLFPMP